MSALCDVCGEEHDEIAVGDGRRLFEGDPVGELEWRRRVARHSMHLGPDLLIEVGRRSEADGQTIGTWVRDAIRMRLAGVAS